ncbi:MAG: EVE domain-containing protein [Spongiibacteraceae bacterium]|jgi:predicted RNA-binding protein with PUA-like domain|nr:EVE domain-containing protein [Spongiibacteraceae bacterium]
MGYWLFKTEPQTFSIDDLKARARRGEFWDGVRNYQARNMLRDEVARGDQVLIYHSSCAQIGVVGVAEVIRAASPDPTQFDPESDYYDPASEPEAPRWYGVTLAHRRTLPAIVSLASLKANPALADLALVKRGNRLSIMPVTASQWRAILATPQV